VPLIVPYMSDEGDHIEPPFAAFKLRDERLRANEPRRELSLRQPAFTAQFRQPRDQPQVARRAEGFVHERGQTSDIMLAANPRSGLSHFRIELGVPAMPTRNAPVADRAPTLDGLTDYDRSHTTVYLRLLDAAADGADWREAARIVLDRDPDAEGTEACYTSHLARARWMTERGYRFLVQEGARERR
jgi:hypothetical protein